MKWLRKRLSRLRNKITRADDIIALLDAFSKRLAQREKIAHEQAEKFTADIGVQIKSLEIHGAFLQTQKAQADTRNILTRMEKQIVRVNRALTQYSRSTVSNTDSGQIKRVKVHFFFQTPETWTSWESVWSACSTNPKIEPLLVLLPFQHDSMVDENHGRKFLANRNLTFVNWSAYDIVIESPDVVFLHNPYDSTRPTDFSVKRLTDLGIHIAYIPYALDLGGDKDNMQWQYDMDVQKNAWRIFVRSEQHRRMYAMYCQAGNRHVVVSGHPKMDAIKAIEHSPDCYQRPQALLNRKVILWTPHFNVATDGYSTFPLLAEQILAYFENEPEGLTLLVRPHPLFFGRLAKLGMLDIDRLTALRNRLHRPPYIYLDEDSQYLESFYLSDGLMADVGSFLLEYLPTKKPILYLQNPKAPELNESGSFVDKYYRATNFQQVCSFIEMLANDEDPLRDERIALIPELLHNPTEGAGTFISNYIIEHFDD